MSLLQQARELITDPAHWTQEVFARNALGKSVMGDEPDAVCWCADGALHKIRGGAGHHSDAYFDAYNALNKEVEKLGHSQVESFNDKTTHAEVLGVFDRAIENLRQTA